MTSIAIHVRTQFADEVFSCSGKAIKDGQSSKVAAKPPPQVIALVWLSAQMCLPRHAVCKEEH